MSHPNLSLEGLDKNYWILILSITFIGTLFFGFQNFLGVYLRDVFGWSQEMVLVLLFSAALISVVLFPFCNFLVQSFGRKKMLILSPAISIIALVLLAFAGGLSNLGISLFTMVSMIIVLIAISNTLGLSALLSYLRDNAPMHKLRLAYGIVFLWIALCQIVGSIGFAYIWSYYEYSAFLIPTIILTFIGILMRFFLSEPHIGKPFSNLATRFLMGILTVYILGSGFALGFYSITLHERGGLSLLEIGIKLSAGSVLVIVLGALAAWSVKSMSPKSIIHSEEESRKGFHSLVGMVVGGAVGGYFAGWIIWLLFGQIQLMLGMDFPYAALYTPPLIYQIGWIVYGAVALFINRIKT